MKRGQLIAAIVLCVAAMHAAAQDLRIGELSVHDPWARPLPPVADDGAVYLRVVNHAAHADRLLAASTPIAERVEFHAHVHSGSMMMMQRIDAVSIEAQASVTMAPGGMHVMLVGLKKPLVAGEAFALTLTFEKAGIIVITVPIEARANAAQIPAQHPSAPAVQHRMKH